MRRALEGDPVGGGSSQRWCRERAALRQPPASTPGTRGCHRAGPAGDRDLAPGCHSTLQSWVSLPCSGHLSHFLSIQEPWSCCACSWGSSAGPRGLAAGAGAGKWLWHQVAACPVGARPHPMVPSPGLLQVRAPVPGQPGLCWRQGLAAGLLVSSQARSRSGCSGSPSPKCWACSTLS